MAYNEKYLKENIKVKCEFLFKGRDGQNETKICSLGELDGLTSYERNNLVGLVVFPMPKNDKRHNYPMISNLLENFIKDFPQLRHLAVTSQFVKINISNISKNCPSLARYLTIKDVKDPENRDVSVVLKNKKWNHNKTFEDRESDNAYFCELISGDDDKSVGECEIIDIYDFYDMPKEYRNESTKVEDNSVKETVEVFEQKKEETNKILESGGETKLDFTTSERTLRNILYGMPIDKRKQLGELVGRINPYMSRDALSKALPNVLLEDTPKLFAAPEGYREELVEELVAIIQNMDEENISSTETKVLEEELSKIVLAGDSLFFAYNIEKSFAKNDDDLKSRVQGRVQRSASSLGDDFAKCYKRKGLTNEVAAKVNNILGGYITNHGNELVNSVYGAIVAAPNIDTIRGIVDKAVEDKNVTISDKELDKLKDSILDTVVQKLGNVNRLSADDLYNIGAIVYSACSDAKSTGTNINITNIKEELNKMVTAEFIAKIKNEIKPATNINVNINTISSLGLIDQEEQDKKADDNDDKKISTFEERVIAIIEKHIKQNQLTKEDVDQMMTTHFGTLINQLTQIGSISQNAIITAINNATTNITNNQNTVKNDIVNNITNNNQKINVTNIEQIYENIVKTYVQYNAIAQNMLQAYQTAMLGGNLGIANNVSLNGLGSAGVATVNPLMNPAISNILMLSMLGGGLNPVNQQNIENISNTITNNVTNNINTTVVQPLNALIVELTNAIKLIQEQAKKEPKEEKKEEPKKDPKKDPKEKKTETPKIEVPKYKKVAIPEKTKEYTFKEKSIENLEKLYEPKKKASILKSFARKPVKAVLAATGIGIAAGVGLGLVGSAATLASGIGLAGILSVAGTIAAEGAVVGAAVGGISGGVLRSVASGFNFVRRERLYQKFQNKYKKAMNSREVIEIDDAKLLLKEQEKEELRNKLKSATNERQRNRALKAVAKKRADIRRVKDQKNIHLKKFTSRVEEASTTKDKLNALEEKTNKTTSLGGTLQYLRNKREEVARGKLTSEDYEDIKSSVNEELSDIFDKDVDIDKMSPEHKTYDAELSGLISSIDKMKRSSAMNKTLKEIEKRHSQEVENDVVITQYDLADIKAMEIDVANNPTPENIAAYNKIIDEYNRIQGQLRVKGLSSNPDLTKRVFAAASATTVVKEVDGRESLVRPVVGGSEKTTKDM